MKRNLSRISNRRKRWMKSVACLMPDFYLEGLHELVRADIYPSRSAAIRSAIRDLLKRELWNRPKKG